MKRKQGEKSGVLLTTIDLQIIKALKEKEMKILELADKLEIKHKNLKPHIDLLVGVGLINALPIKKSRGIKLSLPYSKENAAMLTKILNDVNDLKKAMEDGKIIKNPEKK